MGLLSNRVSRESLKSGDHIYSWRTAYIYAHHGIYVGDDTVIHFTRHGQEVGTGTTLDVILLSSAPKQTQTCLTCTPPGEGHGVVSSCLNCFLAGGILYKFEYAVNPTLFLAKVRGGTCTLAVSDPNDIVVHRAKHLLENGFGCYNVFKNNCENFTIYCKTGLLVVDLNMMGQSSQVVSIIGAPLSAVVSTTLRLVTTNIYGMVATAGVFYCANRYAADIGTRKDVIKISAEDLTNRLASGFLQVVEPATEKKTKLNIMQTFQAMLIYGMWVRRNYMIFANKTLDTEQVTRKVMDEIAMLILSNVKTNELKEWASNWMSSVQRETFL